MKDFITKTNSFFSRHLPTKRRLIQLYSALLFNCYSKGYITGEIFTGVTKNLCTPGLNCYSCPGAVTSCPLGALQNAFSDANKTLPYYIFGILMLYGVIFGRWICGWLCPFGLVQDLIHKIKTPKLKKNAITKALSYFKYVILVIFVIIIPLAYMFKDFPLPAFCKYICPAGTLGGAIGLLINPANEGMFGMLGPLFTWKFVLMVSMIVGMIFIYRMFCRFLCPLGAIYGLFNKFSLFGIKLNKDKCIDCGKCISVCPMDIKHVGDHECISCGRCVGVCPTKAISYGGSKIILPDSELEGEKTEEEKTLIEKKREKRMKIVKIVSAILMVALLSASLIYCNFIADGGDVEIPDDGSGETPDVGNDGDDGDGDDEEDIPIGSDIGYKCPSYGLELVNGGGKINIRDLEGKVVVINFWGVDCGPCIAELPHFNEVADEYEEDVVFLIIHKDYRRDEAPDFIATNLPDSKMIFAYDVPMPNGKDMYFTYLGGRGNYPRTLVLDENGIVKYEGDGALTRDELIDKIKSAMSE